MANSQNTYDSLMTYLKSKSYDHLLVVLRHGWYHTTPQPFYGLFPEPPGWASARRELLDFMVQGKTNRERHTDHPAGRHSIRTNQCPPPPSPIFFTGRMPFLPPNQQRQNTEGMDGIANK